MVVPPQGSRIERRGARVILVDRADAGEPRVLMVRGHDPHDVDRSFWFTPGGGLEDGESMRAAAVRELVEETGYLLEASEVTGPIWTRTALFDFASRPYTQHEELYLGWLSDAQTRERTAHEWTEVEQETIDEVAWLTEAELRESAIEVFPAQLQEDWAVFMEWDGVTRHLGEVDE